MDFNKFSTAIDKSKDIAQVEKVSAEIRKNQASELAALEAQQRAILLKISQVNTTTKNLIDLVEMKRHETIPMPYSEDFAPNELD